MDDAKGQAINTKDDGTHTLSPSIVNLFVEQFFQFTSCQTTLCTFCSSNQMLVVLFRLDKLLVEDTTIKCIGERQTHTSQHCGHQVEYFSIRCLEAVLKRCPVNIKNN